jgi:hypothetical protein
MLDEDAIVNSIVYSEEEVLAESRVHKPEKLGGFHVHFRVSVEIGNHDKIVECLDLTQRAEITFLQ